MELVALGAKGPWTSWADGIAHNNSNTWKGLEIMGSVEELAKAAFGGTHYTATFRFHYEPARRMSVSEMGMGVENFRAFASGAEVHPSLGTDDELILLSLVRIRAHKRLGMWLWAGKESSTGAYKLNEIWKLKGRFLISLGVQKRVDGQLAGLYILRDPAAKVFLLSTLGSGRSADGYAMWDVVLDLSKPEILHGPGSNLDARHFKRI